MSQPVWDNNGVNDVQSLFKAPPFISDPTESTETGSEWYNCMTDFGVYLYDTTSQQNNVFANGWEIYAQLSSGKMPKATTYFTPPWPADALKMFQVWYNQGGRVHTTDPLPSPNVPNPQIPDPTPVRPFKVPSDTPVWDSAGTEDDIKMIFTSPCWETGGACVAGIWREEMLHFQYDASTTPPTMFDLQNYDHVKVWALSIYNHIASGSMPVNTQRFPDEPVAALKTWHDQGCPKTKADVGKVPKPTTAIPSSQAQKPFVIRKDINTLSPVELRDYREQLMKLNAESTQSSTWQTGGFLHADWCLHYMQASFPWHRAHLLWLESQIGGPIPYWNFYSSKATDPTSADSGLPQAFLDDTFVDSTGKTQPNPLRHALARDGKSRASTTTNTLAEVQRAPELIDPSKRADYINKYVPTYLGQIHAAVVATEIGIQTDRGFTYAQPDLTAANAASYYAAQTGDFDGALEQAHDNLHWWTGPDMANNSYAAFDPLFWSFHANFDRIFETWLRANGATQKWKSTPLLPFALQAGGEITTIEGEKDVSKYTSTPDMVVDSKSLGYTYLAPGNPDYTPSAANVSFARAPLLLFPDVKCTDKTYYIHAGLDNGDGKDLVVGGPGYVGSVTRLGMGPNNGNDRCIQNGIVRKLEGAKAANELGLAPDTPVNVKLLVREDQANKPPREVPHSEYKDWAGFKPVLIWAEPVAGIIGFED